MSVAVASQPSAIEYSLKNPGVLVVVGVFQAMSAWPAPSLEKWSKFGITPESTVGSAVGAPSAVTQRADQTGSSPLPGSQPASRKSEGGSTATRKPVEHW